MPRDQRFVLRERMERRLFEVLENLIRLAKDRHCLSLKGRGMAMIYKLK